MILEAALSPLSLQGDPAFGLCLHCSPLRIQTEALAEFCLATQKLLQLLQLEANTRGDYMAIIIQYGTQGDRRTHAILEDGVEGVSGKVLQWPLSGVSKNYMKLYFIQ